MNPPSDRPTPSGNPSAVVVSVPADDAGMFDQEYVTADAIDTSNGIGRDIVHGNNDVPRL